MSVIKSFYTRQLEKRCLSFLFFNLAAFLLTNVATAQSNTAKRDVLFKLKENEVIKYNEYYVEQLAEKDGFACIVRDTVLKKESFVFNGKVIFSEDEIGTKYSKHTVLDLELSKKNGYIYKFTKDGQLFVNCRGTVEGPFDEVNNEKYYTSFYCDFEQIPDNADFYYSLAGRWYAYKDGKTQFIKPKNDRNDYYGGCSRSFQNGKWYFDEVSGLKYRNKTGFDSLVSYKRFGNNIGFIFMNNGKRYFSYNDQISNAFDNEGYNFIDLDDSKYMYSYQKNGKTFVNINGNIKELGENIRFSWSSSITESGSYYLEYSKGKNNYYVYVNGKKYGPYNDIAYHEGQGRNYSNGNFAFIGKKDGLFYANINGIESKGYPSIHCLDFRSDGTYKYLFSKEDGWVYSNENGRISRTNDRKIQDTYVSAVFSQRLFDDSKGKYDIFSKNKKHNLYTDIKYDYVVIDGRGFGKAPAMKAWFDNSKNAFVWNAWENKELVVYEYTLN